MILAIVLTAMICGTIAFVVAVMPLISRNNAQAKLISARAGLLRIEKLERQIVLNREAEQAQRNQEARKRRRRAVIAKEARQ